MIKKKFVIFRRLILGRLASWKNDVAWRVLDYCWGKNWKKVYKHLKLLETFFGRNFVRLEALVVDFSD